MEGTVFEFEGDIRMGGSCAGDGGGNLLVGNVAPGTVEVGVDDELDRLECGYMDAASHCRSVDGRSLSSSSSVASAVGGGQRTARSRGVVVVSW